MELTPPQYLTLGYTIALGLLWGYAALLWWQLRDPRLGGGQDARSDRQ